MRRIILEILGDIFLVCQGVFLLWCFLNIYFKGGFMFAVEPNTTVLILEIMIASVIVVVGLERYFDDTKRKKEQENDS